MSEYQIGPEFVIRMRGRRPIAYAVVSSEGARKFLVFRDNRAPSDELRTGN